MIVKITWFLRTLVIPSTITTVILFWSFVFNWSSSSIGLIYIFEHAVVLVPVMLDVLFCPSPVLYLQTIYYFLYCLFYILWTFAFYKLDLTIADGHHYIYPFLSWENPATTGIKFLIGVMAGIPILNFVHWMVSYIYRQMFIRPRVQRSSIINNGSTI